MSFTRTKDRVWGGYDVFAAWLARRPMPVRKAGYGLFGLVLWVAYILPRSKVRATFRSLAHHVGASSSRRLFHNYVRNFLLGMNRIEQVRHGFTSAIDAMLQIPEQERLDRRLQGGGVLLVIPHAHASLAMGRGLAQRYPLLALVRSTGNERRAASEWEIYENLGCEFLDVRQENPTIVARKVLKALRNGRLVVGIVDRIRTAPPPDRPVDVSSDSVRGASFGEPIGLPGWPGRFSWKAGTPIIPATVVQGPESIILHLGTEVSPTESLVETTQAWIDELERLLKAYPEEWTFSLDKHWSKALRDSMNA